MRQCRIRHASRSPNGTAHRYSGTLLKLQIEVQWLTAGNRRHEPLEGRRWRGMRPGVPAAVQEAPRIEPTLHVTQG